MLQKILWSAGFIALGLIALVTAFERPSDRGACSNGADWLACFHGTVGSRAQLDRTRED